MNLKEKKILIVGDTGRKRHYEELVNEFGGIFYFIDGVKDIKRSRKEAKKADIIFHIVAYGVHNIKECIEGTGMRVLVNSDGMSSLRRAIEAIERDDFSAVVEKSAS